MIADIAFRPVLLALDPVERWAAARNIESYHWSVLDRPAVWIPLLVVGGLGVATLVVYRRHRLRRKVMTAFGQAASQVDLAPGERTMLVRIAEAADPRPIHDAQALASVFEDGVRRVLANRATRQLTPQARRSVQDVIASVRIKLGFVSSEPSAPSEALLDRDDRVTVARPGERADVEATVIGIGGVDVTVRLDAPFDLRVGGPAVLRKVRGGTQWEHNLAVTRIDDLVVRARLIGSPSRKNLRRFVRVPIRRPVYVARYGFIHEDNQDSLPQFVSGTLHEIAGPGLRLEADLDVDVGERVLVVLDLGREGSLRAVGVVRRRVAGKDDGPADVAVELIPVTEEEVARLVKETNAAARRTADTHDAAAADDHAAAAHRTTA